MPDGSLFTLLSIDQVQTRLSQLHQKVCRDKGRVEIKDSQGTCVLISKEELETLEQALEILSNTSDVQKMARTIAVLTHSVAQGPLAATRVGAN
jgi:PHD/YefM family antitoxin component YafN of YafNO toxin-antitoxin module